jgi:predicted small secreted protein
LKRAKEMKKILVVLLVGSAFALNGCVTVTGNTVKAEGSEIKVYHTSAMADIDYVSNLSDQAKVDGYKAIAERRFLTQAERAYLVEAVKKDSLDQKQKDEILLVLLNNPTVGSGGPDVKTNKPKCSK